MSKTFCKSVLRRDGNGRVSESSTVCNELAGSLFFKRRKNPTKLHRMNALTRDFYYNRAISIKFQIVLLGHLIDSKKVLCFGIFFH